MTSFGYRLLSDVPLIASTHLFHFLPNQDREQACAAFGRSIAESIKAAESPWMAKVRAEYSPKLAMSGDGVATLAIKGPLAANPDVWEMAFYGVEDTCALACQMDKAMCDPSVKGVLLSVDSPGGMMMGGADLAEAIKRCASCKPVVAHASGMMASLAYMVGSQASEVIASPGSLTGSIGVIASWPDLTQYYQSMGVKFETFTNKEATYKGIGFPGKPLSDAQREHMQESVQSAFQDFTETVRGTRPQVPDSAMRGQVFRAKDAKANGLVDRVGNQDFALSVLRERIRNNNKQ